MSITLPFFKRDRARPVAVAPELSAGPQGITAGFPRGVAGDGNTKPVATGWWPSSAELAAKLDTWQPGHFLIGRDETGRYYGHRDDRHILTVAGTRAGKGVSLIVPNILYFPGSCILIDPKGELATLTASRRSAQGSTWAQPMDPGRGHVFVLDPFERVSGPAVRFRSSFNPLADLDPNTERGIELSWQIADALVKQSDGDGAFWTQSARSFLRGLILYIASSEPPASKNLIRLRELVTQDTTEFNAMLARMHKAGGIVRRTADAMNNRPPQERMSVLSTCEVHTSFLEGPSMERVLRGSDFALEDLKTDRLTVYLCLPATKLATHERWLRLMVALAIDAIERTGIMPAHKPPVLFCLDEFAALGHMSSIESAAGQIAGFGARLWPIVQDVTQLQRDYKAAWETFMGNAGLLTFFGNTDITTLEHVAKRLGETEVNRPVESRGDNWSEQTGGSRPDWWSAIIGTGSGSQSSSTTRAGSTNSSLQITRAALMNPDEFGRLFSRGANNVLAAISRPDLPPFALSRCAYFSPDDAALFGGLYDPLPEMPAPHTTAAERVERDAAKLWHVPVVDR